MLEFHNVAIADIEHVWHNLKILNSYFSVNFIS